MIEETGTEIIKRAVDRIDNALEEIDRIARAMNELGMSAGGDLFVAWREIVGGVSESRRGILMAEGMIETVLFASRHNDETGECEPVEMEPATVKKLREKYASEWKGLRK